MTAPIVGDPFTALADQNRREIISLLREGEMSVQEIADELPISRPAVSRHLKVLKGAGLVAERAEGNRHICRLAEAGLEELYEYLDQMWGDVAARYRMAVENTTDRGGGS